jgi:hypothetical protein
MKSLKTWLTVLLLSTFCLLTSAFGQFTPKGDSYVDNVFGDMYKNFGSAPLLYVTGATFGGGTYKTYIQFDLSAIPSGYTNADIAKATLKLYVNGVTTAGGFEVDAISGPWFESTITDHKQPTLQGVIVPDVQVTAADTNQYILIDITSTVQGWVDVPSSNNGIALLALKQFSASFDSKENATTSHPPELDIVFSESAGSGITGITTANGSGLTGGGTSGNLSLSLTPCPNGQVLASNGSGWICSTVGGGGGGITGSGTVNSLPLFNGLTSIGSSNVFQSTTNTNIGIGTTTPAATLDVNGSVNSATSFNIGETPFAFGSSTSSNAFLGFAGNSASTNPGQYNTASGYQALLNNASNGNTANGAYALYSNQGSIVAGAWTGGYNTASGLSALYSNCSGGCSSAFQGDSNTANGSFALPLNTTGSNNTASGASALYASSTGSYNTANGALSLYHNSTGSYDTGLGYLAGPDASVTASLNNTTAVGAFADVTQSNSLVLGSIVKINGCNPSGTPPCLSTNVGIGTTAPAYPLDVNGIIRSSSGGFMFPDGTVQTTKASGGGGSGTVTSVGSGPGLIGGPITTSGTLTIDTSVVPLLSGSNTFGGAITAPSFAGNGAGLTNVNAAALGGFSPSTFATVGANTYTGNQTITGSLFTSGNVGVGTTTPQATLDVNGNINLPNTSSSTIGVLSIGGAPFLNNYGPGGPSGPSNTFVGGWAGNINMTGGGNSAFGNSAFTLNTSGSLNTALGVEALSGGTTGTGNTGVGAITLFANQTGSNNTALGFGAGDVSATALNNTTAIGAYADATQSNSLVLGAINGTNGCAPPNCNNTNVGIGTTAPHATLDVEAPSGSTPAVNFFGTSSTPGTFAVNGNTTLTNLTVTGTCTGCGSGGGSGTVTSVGSGPGLIGGPITTSGTLTIDTSVVPLLSGSNTFGGAITAPSFAGNGAGLTNVNAAALGGFSPSTFATVGANTYTGNQTITGSLFTSGNVGVGTTTPQATLDVNGAINAATSFNLSGQPFVWGNYSTLEANTAVGFNTLPINATGNINTAVGYGALSSNTTGADNTAVGDYALQQNTAGSQNTAVGEGALNGNTGNFNTGLGFHVAAGGGNFNNATAIGSNAEVDESNALVLGSILNTNDCVAANNCASVNVGIGTTTPQFTLDVHGNANITGTLTVGSCNGCGGGGGGGSGTVTQVNAGAGLLASPSPITTSGTLSINTAVVPQLNVANTFAASQSITGNLTATGTVSGAILSGTTITGTTITGTTVSASKLFATGGLYLNGNTTNPFAYASGSGVGDNAFLGFAGESVNAAAPGDENTGVGYQALNVNGTGSTGGFQSFGNSAMGAHALFNNTTGNDNTASGTNTLYNNTAGNYNAANGDGALFANTAGNNNTASGHSSLYNTTGSFNTASGSNALQYNAGGSYNTALGAFSGPDTASTGLTNSTAIGAYTVVSQSNSLVLGSIGGVNGCTSPCLSTSVGIGTAMPQATLDVEGLAATPPTVNFGSPSIPATFTVNGNTTLANLTVTGTCTGCGSGGGGGGITNVIAGTDLTGGGTGPTVTLNLNTSATDLRYSQLGAANTYSGTQTINSSTGNGVSATSSNSSSSGLSGSNISTSGLANGVAGSTNSALGSGVVGVNQSTAILGGGYGVYGLASTPANVGVGGVNNTTAAGSAYGVFGQSLGSTGAGVFGTGIGSGVTGSTSSPTGTGVVATNFATSGNAYGVYAQSSSSPSGTGVYGTGSAAGIYGVAASSTGTGVVGVSNAGWAGFFQGSVNITNNLSVVNNAQVLGNLSVTGNTTLTGNAAVTGNATVAGTLAVGGDTPMSHSPRMTFSGTVASFTTSPQAAGFFIPDQPIVITRLTAAVGAGQTPDPICQSDQNMTIFVTGNQVARLAIPNPGFVDSGSLNISVPAGALIYVYGNSASSDLPGCQSGSNITATVEYAMQ